MTYTVNDDNQYTVMKDVSLTYDPAGNLLTNGSWTYSWDNENRLTQVVSTSKLIQFSYDTQGRRIEKKVWNNTTGTGTPATYLKYLYDGWNLIAELNGNSNNAKVRSYTWGLDISGSTTEAGGVGGLLMVDDASNGVHFVSYDPNGNIMGLVKATNGTVSAAYEYGPFGELLSSTGSMSSSNPFRFSTKYRDNETDLYYYGYRYYSPSLGRWLSRDPVEERGGLNLYAFVNNDSVNKFDVLGNVPYFKIITIGNSINNGILACYNCYLLEQCLDRVKKYAEQRRKYKEKDHEKYIKWVLTVKPGAECIPLATECGIRMIKVAVWLGTKYLVLKYYAGGHY